MDGQLEGVALTGSQGFLLKEFIDDLRNIEDGDELQVRCEGGTLLGEPREDTIGHQHSGRPILGRLVKLGVEFFSINGKMPGTEMREGVHSVTLRSLSGS